MTGLHQVTFDAIAGRTGRFTRLAAVGLLLMVLAGCDLFGAPKLTEETIIPPETLYASALSDMDGQRYLTAIGTLQKLERQHPYSQYNEKAKLMFPTSDQMPYVLYLKGNAYFSQITDITRDQQTSQNAIDAYTQVVTVYPKSKYAKDAGEKLVVAYDQLAGKEMSVGRYYEGTGQYPAAIARFRIVVDKYQTSSNIEEALFRLTEANLALGLTSEAQTAAAVLGHNYPSSDWYKEAFDLLQKQGVQPKINPSSTLATALKGK